MAEDKSENIRKLYNNELETTHIIDKKEEQDLILPTIPLRGLTVFPNNVLHFDIGREKSKNALESAMIKDKKIFLAAQKDERTDLPGADDFYHVGTIGTVKQVLKLSADTVRVLVEGECRGKIIEVIADTPYFKCKIEKHEDEEMTTESTPKVKALSRSLEEAFKEYISLNPKISNDIVLAMADMEHPGKIADFMANHMDIKVEEQQKFIEYFDVAERMENLYEVICREIEVMKIEQNISAKVKDQMNQNQKEYLLKEQMRAIQDELGIGEEIEDEVQKWNEQLEELKLGEKTEEKIKKEISRFGKMQPGSAEGAVIRTYVETLLELPWKKRSKGNIDISKAEKILNEDHYGLEKVKDRILEYLAVIRLSKKIKGPIICLVGPPGVGKTSIAKSVARATNRKFVRMSLGGVRDEAEIRGHRRTYIGAIPGRVINGIKETGTNNPVFLFDEVDKIGADFKGDPASALLEVLDPEQNKDFTDHYLEVPFDLSKVMFITTANTTDTIPRPLLDRMEIIEVSGYTEEDKVQIAENYLVPKKVKEHGLKDNNIKISEETIRELINYYTRESGVRNLEREIANLCRKVARKLVSGEGESFDVTPDLLEDYLGKKKFHFDKIENETEVGVTTGLAWTIVGGDTLFIESAAVPGTGKIELTGQMGDVMQESAKIGVGYIRTISDKLHLDREFYKKNDLHIHIPEGAVPKDGPSAGVTMCTSVVSALTGQPVKKDIAMTGELTLKGNVLPVGGIREKVLAAHRAGIRKVLLPEENRPDVDDIPEKVRNEMEFVHISRLEDALDQVIVKS